MIGRINIVTLFPDFFTSPFQTGLLGKCLNNGLLSVSLIDLRDFSEDKFRRCDDYPYGGGSGMVLKPEPLFRCLESLHDRGRTLLTSASGRPFTASLVHELSAEESVTIICGHYEGVDQRVSDRFVDDEISIGDYVLSGGEFAATVIVDAIARHIPGFMSNAESLKEESYEEDLLEYPHYTRPEEIEGMRVPEVLLSGNHALIQKWRLERSIEKTASIRPDLMERYRAQDRTEK